MKLHALWKHPMSQYSYSNISESILWQLQIGEIHWWSPEDISLKYPSKRFFFDLVTLIYDIDLQIVPRYPSTWPPCRIPDGYVCPFGCESGKRHTLTWCQNYVTDVGCNKLKFRIISSLTWGVTYWNFIFNHIFIDWHYPLTSLKAEFLCPNMLSASEIMHELPWSWH